MKSFVLQISVEFVLPLISAPKQSLRQSIIVLIKPEAESAVRHCDPSNRGMSYYWAELDDFVVFKRRYLLYIIQESLAATIQVGSLS